MKVVPEEYHALLAPVQAVDFALKELNLYLDTHPHDAHALQQYHEMSEVRRHLKHQFEAHFGPLLPSSRATTDGAWHWAETPWPWQV